MSTASTTTQTQSGTSTTNPWEAQAPYLTQGFSAASDALKKAQGVQGPNDFVAQFTPQQLSLFQNMLSNPATGIGGSLAGAGAGAAQGALSGLGNYTPQGGVGSNIAAAGQYANNPAMSGMVDAAMRDSTRAASEQMLPQIARNAAAGGNLNNSRRAISEGIVQRGLSDQAGDISSQLRGNAYQQGLGLAESGRTADNAGILSALTARAGLGTGAAGAGIGALSSGYDIANQGGAGQMASGQANLDNLMQRYNFGTQSPFAGLQNYWNTVGGQNWGGTTNTTGTSTTSKNPSIWETAGGLMSAGGSLAKGASGFMG